MSSASYPLIGGGGGVPIYSTFSAFPAGSVAGDLAVAADTGNLYEWNGASWQLIASPGGALSLGAFGSSPNANGLTLSGGVLNMQPADGTHPGGVSITTQSFAGGKTFLSALSMNNQLINNLSDPASAQDAATKSYVDMAINGLFWLAPVKAISFSNVALTGSTPLVIDGYTVLNGDRIALGTQSTTSQQNIYTTAIVASVYTLTAVSPALQVGDAFLVLNGTVHGNDSFVVTALSPAVFVQFAGPNTISIGAIDSQTPSINGLTLIGNVLYGQSASATNPGMVNNTTQTLSGAKTFSTAPVLSSLTASLPLQLDASKNIISTPINLASAQVTGILALTNGGTGASSAAAARVSLDIDQRSTFSDAAYLALNTDRVIAQIGTMTAPRTVTLPAANTLNAGQSLVIFDQSGTVTTTNMITIAAAGADTINGSASKTIRSAYGYIYLYSNGSNGWTAGVEAIGRGGTGLSTLPADGQLLIGSSASSNYTLATITAGTGMSVTNGGGSITLATTGAPPTGAAGGDLGGTYPNPTVLSVADVTTGVLSLTNGGTAAANVAAAGAIAFSTASAINFNAPGSSGQLLRSAGTGTPTWTTATFPITTAFGSLLLGSGTNTWTTLAPANTSAMVTSSGSTVSWTSGSTANRVLRTNGTTVSFAQVALATDASGVLPNANGGTNQSTYTTGDILYSSATNTLSKLGIGSSAQVLTVSAGIPSWQAAGNITVTSQTTTYAILSTDGLILCSGSAFTATLPTAVGVAGETHRIVKTDSSLTNIITIATTSSQTIGFYGTSVTINTQGETWTLTSDGANWQVVGHVVPSILTSFTGSGSASTNTTYTTFWKRIGDSLQVNFKIAWSGSPGTVNPITLNLPSGLTIDTTKIINTTANTDIILGSGSYRDDSATTSYYAQIAYDTTTAVSIKTMIAGGGPANITVSGFNNTSPVTIAANDYAEGYFMVPISGWNG